MSVLSISFHVVTERIDDWEAHLFNYLTPWFKDLCGDKRVLVSEVQSNVVAEGKNYNILIFFDNTQLRDSFFDEKLPELYDNISQAFSDTVMIFPSKLNIIG